MVYQMEHPAHPGSMNSNLLYRLGDALARSSDLAELYPIALDGICRALDTDRAAILLADRHGVMRFEAHAGLSEAYRRAVEGHSPWAATAVDPAPIFIPDALEDTGLAAYHEVLRAEGIRALGFVPILEAGRAVGKFMVYRREPHEFRPEEIQFAGAIARQLALGIERTRERQREKARMGVLEHLARNAPLPHVLELLAGIVEENSIDGALVSILLFDPVQRVLTFGAGPSLPDWYNRAIDGVGVGPNVGTCGIAAHEGRLVVSPDLMTDPNWAPFRQLVVDAGLRACWSTPILSSGGEVLGTFALYHRTPRQPSPRDLGVVEFVTRTAALAIERARAEAEREALIERIRESDRRKDEFLAMLAHELRNPLAPILTAAELLRHDAPAAARVAGVIERQARHMSRLVDDLLDVSRITRGTIELRRERIDLLETVRRALDSLQALAEERGHAIVLELPAEPLPISADPVRVEQVLVNVLHNALKYTPPNGTVAIRLAKDGEDAVLTVQDDGVGIDPAVLPTVFELFVQADSRPADGRSGLGIGLTLVKRLVELHGGSVCAHSEGVGRGTRVTIRLPARVGSEAGVASEAARRAGANGAGTPGAIRILVVDDNADATEMLALLLRAAGHEVVTAPDGPAALAAVRRFDADLALLDLGLPGMSGHALGATLREAGFRGRLLALSGYGTREDVQASAAAGFDGHLVKPVDLAHLETEIASLARRPAG